MSAKPAKKTTAAKAAPKNPAVENVLTLSVTLPKQFLGGNNPEDVINALQEGATLLPGATLTTDNVGEVIHLNLSMPIPTGIVMPANALEDLGDLKSVINNAIGEALKKDASVTTESSDDTLAAAETQLKTAKKALKAAVKQRKEAAKKVEKVTAKQLQKAISSGEDLNEVLQRITALAMPDK